MEADRYVQPLLAAAVRMMDEPCCWASALDCGHKQRVRDLHEVLGVALEKGQVPLKIFSIVDQDADDTDSIIKNRFTWDVYHIEYYLLETKYVLKTVKDIGVTSYSTEQEIYAALRECARETLTGLVRHRLASTAHSELAKAIHTTTDPHADKIAPLLSDAILRSIERMSKLATEAFSLERLKEREVTLRSEYERDLAADSWRKRFRGREVLRRFAGKIGKTTYEVLRDLIIANMRDAGYQPESMRAVIETILAT